MINTCGKCESKATRTCQKCLNPFCRDHLRKCSAISHGSVYMVCVKCAVSWNNDGSAFCPKHK